MNKIEERENNRAMQAASKLFSTTSPTEDVVKEEIKVEVKEEVKVAEPKRKGRPVVNRETKKRYTLTFLPSIYNEASNIASEEGKSLSEVVGDFLSDYIKSNQK